MSLRTRFLLIVLAGAVVPLALIGLWLTRAAGRSGEALLGGRLTSALDRAVQDIGARWVRQRSDLLTLAEAEPGARGVRFAALDRDVARATLQDPAGTTLWTLAAPGESGEPLVRVTLGVYRGGSAIPLGTLEARLRAGALLGGQAGASVAAGAVLTAFDRSNGATLLAVPFDPGLLARDRFQWGGDEWLAMRREFAEPPLQIVAAAPLTPFVQPFEAAARSGTYVLLGVALTCIGLAAVVTGRLTQGLARLATAADAVSRGDLDRRVDDSSADEVGRVARAFNEMTENLHRTLAELARRESLAAVGQFAATLAHEVRNPLTAIRLDLQRVEESLPADAAARHLQTRALAEVERLDRAVTGTLHLARSGQVMLEAIDLRAPLEAAAAAAAPEFSARGAMLVPLPREPGTLPIRGDVGALEQLFLNLLLNAAQALPPGGTAAVELTVSDRHATVVVRDTGGGIASEHLDRIFDPFFSTKPDGTGLGLAVARQIVLAHGGEIGVVGATERGTAVRVRLPLDHRPLPPPGVPRNGLPGSP